MKIAIIGAGGVGGYFGGKLAHSGHRVTFVARGEHFKAIRENGLAGCWPSLVLPMEWSGNCRERGR